MGQIIDGLKLMVMGMGFVLIFLVVMNILMRVLALLVKPIETVLDPAAPAPKKKAGSPDALKSAAAAAVTALNAFKNGK